MTACWKNSSIMIEDSVFIDANALADFFVGEEAFRAEAEALRMKCPNWVTLPLCRYEFGNVIRLYTRLGKIREGDGRLMLARGLAMVAYCAECDDETVLAEANASRLTFYDAAYVARARSLGMRLHTRDGEILRNCPEVSCPIAGA